MPRKVPLAEAPCDHWNDMIGTVSAGHPTAPGKAFCSVATCRPCVHLSKAFVELRTGEKSDGLLTYEEARARSAAKESGPVAQTWTFVGHWDGGKIVVEYILPGDQPDQRIDTGFWDEGLFAAPASGFTVEEAEAKVRAEYEKDED